MHLLDEPHHDGSALYVSTLTPKLGEVVRVWVRVPAASGVTGVHVRTTPDGEPRFAPLEIDRDRTGKAIGGYGADDVWWRGQVRVHNPVTNYRFMLSKPSGPPSWLTARGIFDHDLPDATDFRLVAYEPPPAWIADAVVYEIFPDRFARSTAAGPLDPATVPSWAVPCSWDTDEVVPNGPETPLQLFGGDLDGIIEHLDHIEELGANTIYLRPVFPAESNHRYNASSFDEVDPLLGGEPALRRLADAVHARGMRLIGDITTNHCGDTHPWFVAARRDPASPERQMFYFDDEGGYECWYGVSTLPKLNWSSPLLRERMAAIVRRWLEYYDGWRVDVANMTGRQGGEDHNHEVAATLRREVMGVRPDAMFIAEHNHDATGDLDRDGWHGTMFYAGFTRPLWTWLRAPSLDLPDFIGVPGGVPHRDGPAVLATIRSFWSLISWRALTHSWLLLDSFDCARFRTVAGTRERHLVGVGLQMTMPGTPMVSAGAEFGLTGRNGEGSRIPMPWDRPHHRDEVTAKVFRDLIALRRSEPALTHGGLRWLYVDADTLVFARETAEESLLVAARRSTGDPVQLAIGTPAQGVYDAEDLVPDGGRITLPGDGPSLRIWRLR
ncbi:MAG: glycoside hydrolase family 13 protein [Micromonosporaceae bacterium]|nr:glycoside hydrolase family 13 protein [Micromonosporaceae bacterium]